MALNGDIYRIIAVHPQSDVVEALMTQLREHGLVVRSSLVDDFKTLTSELSTAVWDLLLFQAPHEHIAIDDVLNYLQNTDKDIPVIVLMQVRDVSAITAMIQQGVAQVLTDDLSSVFATMISRELKQVRAQRTLLLLESNHQEIEKRCLLLLESSRDPIAYIADGMHIAVNLVYAQRFGYQNMEELSGVPLLDMISSNDKSRIKKIIKQFNQPDAPGESAQFTCVRIDGTEFPAQLSFSAATYEGESCIQLMMHEEKLLESVAAPIHSEVDNEKILELSRLDVVTGLYNRFHFEAELEQAICNAVNDKKFYALFYVQLAGYNKLRAKMGVDGIDQVGKEMASLLRSQFNDQAMMSRFSEDVYVVLAKQMRLDETYVVADKLFKSVEAHLFELNEQTFRFTACIGVALSDESVTDSKELLARAMRAVATVEAEKASNGFSVFVKTMEVATDTPVVSAAQELQKAFENNLFKIFFQPIINLRGSSTEFYEVLLRRVNEQGGFESPEQFLRTAAASKIAGIVDRWVIIQSVKTLIARRAQGHSTRIMINLTSQSLQDKTLIPWLTVALKSTRLPKESVIFQVNEDDASTHLKRVQELADSLKTLDCHLGVSRFGNSENSLAMLKHVNLSYIKLDGSFTKNVHQDQTQAQFKEIVQLLHKDNIKSIAPLVESANVLSLLWQVGVDYIQGYYLQPPMEGMNYDFSHDDDAEEP
jgi:diguanylate cyclase (GGDEF)-like protein/PAS domain S-box-containing protein